MNRKRGMTLLEFVTDLIIGLICALILIYLLSLVYGIFFGGKEKAEALQTVNSIDDKTKTLATEEPKPLSLQIPRGWYLVSFENGMNSEKKGIAPQTICANANCVCVCKPKKVLFVFDNSADCQKSAVCKIFIRPFKESGKDLYIKIPRQIEITSYKTGDYEFLDIERK